MTAISYHHFLISFRCLSWLSETKGNTSFLLQDWKHVLWQLNHHVHITECIFMPFVSLHNHLPLYTKIEFFFFFWPVLGVSGLAQDNGCWWHPCLVSSKLPSPSELPSLGAPALPLLLYQTSSDIGFGGRNLAILVCTHITDCLLRKEYCLAYYYAVKTGGLLLKFHILWLLKPRVFMYQSIYQTLAEITTPSGFCQRGI
jgi:hypothetical protein